jgi:tetratricopeptide (TPR) repeat protein
VRLSYWRWLLALALWTTAAFGAAPSPASVSPELAAAIVAFNAKQYPDARAALEKIVATQPQNAAACYYLGRTLELRGDAAALADAVKWLQKAVELEPNNPTYLGRYGGVSLQIAQRTSSLGAARRGREAMEKAVSLDPNDLDAREGLFQFYQRAPWPLGSSARANAHLAAIRQRDPARATVLSVIERTSAGDYAAAFKLCEAVLAEKPDDYNAHYQFGRTAFYSGERLELGLTHLQKVLTLTPPTPASPTPSQVWLRIGGLYEKLNQPAQARTAYETSLRLDAGNREALNSLERLQRTSSP